MKKVLHLLSSNIYSGAENVVCQIIDTFKDEIEMAYCSPNGTIKEILTEKQIQYIPIGKLSREQVRNAIKRYNPDIIHAHDIRASVLAASCSNNIPVVSHIHGKFEDMSKLSIKSVLYKLHSRKFSHIFAVSESILSEYYFSNTIVQKSSVLYNVVNEKKLKEMIKNNEPKKEYDIIFLGRFSHPKNPLRLIRIISKIIKKLPNIKIALIGDGVLLNDAKSLAKELNVDENINFTGFLKNPYPLLSSSKLMLMSSRTEGTPMCVLESMLLGVPIVSTGVDGIKELIENGSDGYYFDTDENIVNTVYRLLTDEDHRRKISLKAYEKAAIINNIEIYKEKLLSVYNAQLNKTTKR